MKQQIKNWLEFSRLIRARHEKLLAAEEGIEAPILVTGCQRSGTTLLTSLFLNHPAFINYQVSDDSELDGALILSRHTPLPQPGRYCFQTTFLNERYTEYLSYPGKIIFLIRSPLSVVYSMCHHWGRRLKLTNFALNELFLSCAPREYLSSTERFLLNVLGVHSLSRLRKACLSYVGKTQQLSFLQKNIPDRIMVMDYDHLIQEKEMALTSLAQFTNLEDGLDANLIHQRGLHRASRLTDKERNEIKKSCMASYTHAKTLI